MSITKTINIDGKDIQFRASASVPRLYRFKFSRDILKDIQQLQKSMRKCAENDIEFEISDLELFENVAYIMAHHANPETADSIDDWLSEFNVFSIYEVLPQIIELWGLNERTEIESKKKLMQLADN